MRKRATKIVCTLGPASATQAQIQSLVDAGMAVARINMSHGTQAEYLDTIAHLRAINEQRTTPVGILLDTKGAEIRTGDLQTPIVLKQGDAVRFCPDTCPAPAGETVVRVNYDGFADDVRETDCILIDNGELSFSIDDICSDGSVQGTARQDGVIGSRRHINLPGADVDLPSITPKDWEDIAFAAEQAVDWLALSFIRTADEVCEVRDFLTKRGSQVRLITKVETRQAVENIADLIAASDGMMVARGDLGAEVPFDQLPAVQDEIVTRCSDAGKPVIVATHMLESMKEHPIPTRAEMTDVAHAAVTRADATMLSGETASGKHPPVVVDAMHKLLYTTEQRIARLSDRRSIRIGDNDEAQAEAAVSLADSADADALFVFTQSGKTARLVSKFRPPVPIVACTEDASVQGFLSLCYGVHAIRTQFSTPEETVQAGIAAAMEAGLLQSGETIVLIADAQAKETPVSSVQIRTV